MSTALVHRPTEHAALGSVRPKARLSADRLADALIEAQYAGDQYGARILDCMLDRALGLTAGKAL
ncbi:MULTISPECIES: hypothetical protein [Streptomyces]|uniref:hypothetical protein n=1 Tax=Streptomyces TaxID=1883 RepID=UPI0004BDEC23|nr:MULTISPECIES: hypothetical protein [Streptomyces]KOG76952.1 hypothetical protein ADK33_32585 [Streptomyces griseus subsp. rhodochrous]KUJ64237.1 hypothetical protein ACZ90_59385 [Streptomyces albus subsp. albus]